MARRYVAALLCLALSCAVAYGFNAQDLLEDLNTQVGHKQLAAALRLGDFTKYPEVVSALAEKLDDTNIDVTVRAACAKSLGKSTDLSVYPMLQTLAKKEDEKAIVRRACAQSMGAIKGSEAVDDLVAMLKVEKNMLVRSGIEETLTDMKDSQLVAVAVSRLLKDDVAAPSAIRVLGSVGGPGVIDLLAKELENEKASIRLAVIRAIGGIIHPRAAPPLLAFYPKANDAEKVQILSAFGKHPHPDVVKLLMSELENQKTFPAIRRSSALVLGHLVARPAIRLLVKVMLDTTEQRGLRLTCAQALGKFGDRDDYAIAGLIGVLADRKIADTAAISLSRITRRYFGTSKERWTEWFQKWRQTRDRRGRGGH